MTWLIGWAIKIFGGGVLDKVIDAFTKSEDIRIKGKEIDADTIKHAMTSYVAAQADQNATQVAKFQFPWFWMMVALFILPLGVWWSAILIDSTFDAVDWKVANLPTQELRDWAGQMITFLFYTGGTVLGIKAIMK